MQLDWSAKPEQLWAIWWAPTGEKTSCYLLRGRGYSRAYMYIFFLIAVGELSALVAHSSGFPSSFTCRLRFAATDQWSCTQRSERCQLGRRLSNAQLCQLSGRTWWWDGGRTGNRRMSHAPSVHFVLLQLKCQRKKIYIKGDSALQKHPFSTDKILQKNLNNVDSI